MSVTPYSGAGLGSKPLTNITPFTYRDGAALLQILDEFESWLRGVSPELQGIVDGLSDHITETQEGWQQFFDEFMANVIEILEGLNDQAAANLVNNTASKLREALDANFADKETESTVKSGRLSDQSLKELFVQVNKLTRDIRDFGAVSSLTNSSHAAINLAIGSGGSSVYIPEGDWLIEGTVRLREGTTVILHPAAVLWNNNPETEYVFINGELDNRHYASGYSGDGNILVTGGTIDNKMKLDRKIYSSCFGFAHGENVVVSNMKMCNNYRSHFLEFNSMKNSHVVNCKFFNLDEDGMTNREAINIDYAYETGFPAFGSYDNTPCDNVSVTFCEFENVNDGVGSHAWPETTDRVFQHKRVKIKNNTFLNLSGSAIHSNNWIDYEISGNTVEKADLRGIYLQRAFNGATHSNTLVDCGYVADGVETVVFLGSGSSNNNIWGNSIYNTGSKKYHAPYRINDGVGNNIDTTGAIVGVVGLLVSNVPDGNTVDGSTRYTLQNNTALNVDVKNNGQQGIVSISCLSASSNSPRGLYWIRCDANPVISPIAVVVAENVEYATGVLSGNTGNAGKNTLSTGMGKLYVENRSGDPKAYDIKFITM